MKPNVFLTLCLAVCFKTNCALTLRWKYVVKQLVLDTFGDRCSDAIKQLVLNQTQVVTKLGLQPDNQTEFGSNPSHGVLDRP